MLVFYKCRWCEEYIEGKVKSVAVPFVGTIEEILKWFLEKRPTIFHFCHRKSNGVPNDLNRHGIADLIGIREERQ